MCQVAVADRDPALVRVLLCIGSPLPIWIVIHEDLKTNTHYRMVFDVLADGLAAPD